MYPPKFFKSTSPEIGAFIQNLIRTIVSLEKKCATSQEIYSAYLALQGIWQLFNSSLRERQEISEDLLSGYTEQIDNIMSEPFMR